MKNRLPLLLAFATIAVPFSAHAATYTVNSTTDAPATANTDRAGTLRQVLLNANASAEDDNIVFAPGVTGTIALTAANGGILVIGNLSSGALTITGPVAAPGAGIVVSGSNAVRVFQNSSAGAVVLENLTIRDGKTSGNGAGVSNNSGTLTIRNCTLTNNETTVTSGNTGGGAVSNGGGATPGGTLTIINSTLSNNIANKRGGAIYSATGGSTTLQNCTLTGNSVTTGTSAGGAIFNGNGVTNIQSCTIAGNSAALNGGAGVANAITNLTGNAPTNPTTNVQNSIIADNRTVGGGADSGTDVDVFGGTTTTSFVSQGNNAIGDGNAAAGFTGSGDQRGVTAAQINLGSLDNYGGPTQTVALLTGSVAIDKGSTTLTTDQRGTTRPQGAAADIGAFELAATAANNPPKLNNSTFTTPLNVAFSQQLAGSDADAGDTLVYSLSAGSTLPATLTLSSAGLITGTPTTAGNISFSVDVTDGKTTTTAKFIIAVSSAPDGLGPVVTRPALATSYTRDQLAALSYTGTIRDVAQGTVTPSGVSRLLFQLRQGNTSYSGPTDGFTANVGRGYYAAFIDTPTPDTTAGNRLFRRTFSTFIPPASVLTPGSYSIVIAAQDVAGNYSVEVVPVNIVAPAPQNAMSPFGVSGSANGS